jgi:two-component sensor histidine kinase
MRLVRSLVQQLRGALTVSTDSGTTFTVRMRHDLTQREAPAAQASLL